MCAFFLVAAINMVSVACTFIIVVAVAFVVISSFMPKSLCVTHNKFALIYLYNAIADEKPAAATKSTLQMAIIQQQQ